MSLDRMVWSFAVFLLLLSSAARVPSARADEWACPEKLNVRLSVGALDLTEDTDRGFQKFSGAELGFRFVRAAHPQECLLTEEGVQATARRTSLVLRAGRAGGVQVILEGYTSTGKLYAFQGRLDDGITRDWTGRVDSFFYDASNAPRRRLGSASVDLSREWN